MGAFKNSIATIRQHILTLGTIHSEVYILFVILYIAGLYVCEY